MFCVLHAHRVRSRRVVRNFYFLQEAAHIPFESKLPWLGQLLCKPSCGRCLPDGGVGLIFVTFGRMGDFFLVQVVSRTTPGGTIFSRPSCSSGRSPGRIYLFLPLVSCGVEDTRREFYITCHVPVVSMGCFHAFALFLSATWDRGTLFSLRRGGLFVRPSVSAVAV